MMKYSSPVFICGALRSGTTVLHLMLNAHDQINNPGEFDFLFDLIKDKNHYPDPNQFITWLNSNRIFRSHNLRINPKPCFKDMVIALVDSCSKPGALTSMNIHRNFHLVPDFFPNARYIHLLRDPRDVARSSIPMGWAGNVWYGVDHWIDTEKSWDILRASLDPAQYTEIHFEELIHNPEDVLKHICAFLGISYSDTMLSYPEHSTYARPDPALTQQWRLKANPRQIGLIENKVGTMMGSRGYDCALPESRPPSLSERVYLSLQNKLYRAIFWTKRYGVALYIADRFSDRLGPEVLRSYCRARTDRINTRHLK